MKKGNIIQLCGNLNQKVSVIKFNFDKCTHNTFLRVNFTFNNQTKSNALMGQNFAFHFF